MFKAKTISKSNARKNQLYGCASLGLGILCVYLASRTHGSSSEIDNARYLGYLLILAGLAGVIFSDTVEILLNEDAGAILVKKKNFFRSVTQVQSIEQVNSVRVMAYGRLNSLIRFYDIRMALKNGQEIGLGKWSTNWQEIQGEAEALAAAMKCEIYDPARKRSPLFASVAVWGQSVSPVVVAALISVIAYALFYRIKVGPFCPAMWFGTLPVLFIGFFFIQILWVLRNLKR